MSQHTNCAHENVEQDGSPTMTATADGAVGSGRPRLVCTDCHKDVTTESRNAYQEGIQAQQAGKQKGDCPHKIGIKRTAWTNGWRSAHHDYSEPLPF